MAYRLSLEGELAASSRAVMTGELSCARERLSRMGELDPMGDEAASCLHDARKNLKKARSLLRLVRAGLPGGAYRRQMTLLRDSAQAIAQARDADSLLGALADLREHGSGRVPAETLDRVQVALEERARAIHASDAPGLAAAVEGLGRALAQVKDWPEREPSAESLLEGLRRAYADGRSAAPKAGAEPSVRELHEWRKRVKDLWYQTRLVREAWPELLKVEVHQAHALADVLGEDHDLAILLELLRGEGEGGLGLEIDSGPLLELSEQRRGELQARARLLGGRLYAERPKAYRRRMAALLASASQPTVALDS